MFHIIIPQADFFLKKYIIIDVCDTPDKRITFMQNYEIAKNNSNHFLNLAHLTHCKTTYTTGHKNDWEIPPSRTNYDDQHIKYRYVVHYIICNFKKGKKIRHKHMCLQYIRICVRNYEDCYNIFMYSFNFICDVFADLVLKAFYNMFVPLVGLLSVLDLGAEGE